jgi:hypothetical protein
MVSKRPLLSINPIFLFQLAKLELTLNEGCSVLFHKDWDFFEFNTIRNMGLDYREAMGMNNCYIFLFSIFKFFLFLYLMFTLFIYIYIIVMIILGIFGCVHELYKKFRSDADLLS